MFCGFRASTRRNVREKSERGGRAKIRRGKGGFWTSGVVPGRFLGDGMAGLRESS